MNAFGGWHERLVHHRRLVEVGALAVILLVAAFLRLYRLTDIPFGLCLDEVLDGSLGADILDGQWKVYFEEGYGHEPLYHYLQAITVRLWGFNMLGIRLPSALCGLALVALVWWLARDLFGPITALTAAAGLATGWWGVFYGRVGIRASTCPLFLTASLLGFWRGMRATGRQRWLAWGLGGIALGLLLYTYPAARVVVWVPFLIVAHIWLFDRARFRARWKEFLLFVCIASLIAIPILVYLSTHREERVEQLSGPLRELRHGDLSAAWPLARDTLLMPLALKADPRWLYNLSGRPVWGAAWAGLWLGGLALALWRWRQPQYMMLLAWFYLGLVPGMVTPDAPSTIRTIAALPAAYLLVGLPVGEIGRRIRKPLLLGALAGATAVLVVVHGVTTWRDMGRWANHFEAQWRYQTPLFAAARLLDAEPNADPVCVSFPWYAELAVNSLDAALSRTDLVTRWFVGDRALLFPGGASTCRYLYTDATDPDPALFSGWLANATLVRSEQQRPDGRPFFRFYRLPLLDIEEVVRAWADVGTGQSGVYVGTVPSPMSLELPVRWSDKAELVGYTWAGEGWHPGAEVALLTAWKVQGPADPSLTIFAHILDGAGQFVYGEDRLDVPAHTWQAGDILVQVQRFTLSADLPPGQYWPEVGLYTRDDNARLPIVENGQLVADRLLLGPVSVQNP